MTGWIFLTIAVAASTLLWPVGRWGLNGDGRPAVIGLWTSLAMGIVSLIGCVARAELHAPPPQVLVAAGLMGVAYAIGFWVLIMRCLKIGPAGPTVTVNNMAMVFGVLYGVVYLRPHGLPHPLVLAGAAGTCLALLLIGLGNTTGGAGALVVPRSWLPMLMLGGALSGLSFILQTYIGEVQRPFRFLFLALASFASALLLLPALLNARPLVRRREVIAGTLIGAMSGAGLLLTLAAFAYLGSAIVLPFSVTTPVLLMLLIGHFAYREHLARAQLAGSLIGALSVLLLALGSG